MLIDGSTCSIDSWSENAITCTTDTHEETGTYKVMVLVPNKGMADSVSTKKTLSLSLSGRLILETKLT